jgi:hypothetical protein
MTINDILRSIPVFQELMGMKLSFNLGYRLHKITNEIDIVTAQYDVTRTNLLEKFGTLSEDKKQYEFAEGMREAFDQAMSEVHEQELELVFDSIPTNLLESISIEPAKIHTIAWILKE